MIVTLPWTLLHALSHALHAMYSPCPIEPCFLLSSPRFVFPIGFSLYLIYTLSTTIISISLSLHLVLLAPVNSCELHNYYLILSFLIMYSSSDLSTDVFS